jgi:hypothetical protein
MQNFNDEDIQRYLIFILQNKENLTQFLRGLVKPLHEAKEELKLWSENKNIQDATGDALERLGELFNVQREGATDDLLRTLIRAKSFQLKNTGTYDDLKNIIEALTPTGTNWNIEETTKFFLETKTVPQIVIQILDQIDLSANSFLAILAQVRPLGIDWRVELPPTDFDDVLTVSDSEDVETSTGSNGLGEGYLIAHIQV